MRKIVSALDRSIGKVENILIVILVSIMTLMAFLQVVMRNIFSEGIIWGDIFLRHLVLWVGFIGASVATRDVRHINVDALSRLLKGAALRWTHIFIDLVSMVICLILAKAGYKFVQYEIEAGSTLFKDIPSWYFQIIIPVGFALIGFRFFLKILEELTGANQTPSQDNPEEKEN